MQCSAGNTCIRASIQVMSLDMQRPSKHGCRPRSPLNGTMALPDGSTCMTMATETWQRYAFVRLSSLNSPAMDWRRAVAISGCSCNAAMFGWVVHAMWMPEPRDSPQFTSVPVSGFECFGCLLLSHFHNITDAKIEAQVPACSNVLVLVHYLDNIQLSEGQSNVEKHSTLNNKGFI